MKLKLSNTNLSEILMQSHTIEPGCISILHVIELNLSHKLTITYVP